MYKFIFLTHLLGFEHGCSYLVGAGAQEREIKTLQTFVKNLGALCCVIVFVKGIAINCKRSLAEHTEIVHKNLSNCGF